MTGSSKRRAFGDATISLLALAILLVGLVSVNDRFRERVSGLLSPKAGSAELVDASKDVSGVVTTVIDAVKHQSMEHAPLVIFGVAASVLVLFMLRT